MQELTQEEIDQIINFKDLLNMTPEQIIEKLRNAEVRLGINTENGFPKYGKVKGSGQIIRFYGQDEFGSWLYKRQIAGGSWRTASIEPSNVKEIDEAEYETFLVGF